MFDNLLKLINENDTIVIFRHTRPDFDALGSQIGLKKLIQLNYPSKKVYVVGDMNKFDLLGKMDNIDDSVIKDCLAIICDVAEKTLISDNRYLLAKYCVVIDHHRNECNVENLSFKIVDTSSAATCQMIARLANNYSLKIDSEIATALYSGIVTDTGRFSYSLHNDLFIQSGFLIEKGAEYQKIYDFLYTESLEDRKNKAMFTQKFKCNEYGVAYMFNTLDDVKKINLDVFSISRGMVSVMAGIKEVKIWANFTYDIENNQILCEFRSKKIPILDIAKKYGGGGHLLACGCSIDSFATAEKIIEDFNELIRKE